MPWCLATDAARFVAYHGALLLLVCGVVPLCALALLLVEAARNPPTEPRVAAFLGVAASASAWLVVEVGVFASAHGARLQERYLLGAVNLTFSPVDDRSYFLVENSLRLVAIVVIGGLGSLSGAVVGAVWVIGLPAFWPDNQLVPLFTSRSTALLMV